MKMLCQLADSFIYVVSRMGTTGTEGGLNEGLPDFVRRIKKHSGDKPIAVGFGVSTHKHFVTIANIADGVVVGSKIIATLQSSDEESCYNNVSQYCAYLCGREAEEAGPSWNPNLRS